MSSFGILIFYCCHNKLPKLGDLKQHTFIISKLGAQHSSAGFLPKSHTWGETEVLAGLWVSLETLRMNAFPSSFRSWQNPLLRFCRTEVTVPCWLLARGYSELLEVAHILALWSPSYIFKAAAEALSPCTPLQPSSASSSLSFASPLPPSSIDSLPPAPPPSSSAAKVSWELDLSGNPG